MSYTKRFVCLANARSSSGRCVAGIEIVAGKLAGWIRPISTRISEELSLEERRYEDGSDVEVLDILDVAFVEARPHGCHVENHIINDQVSWSKIGRLPSEQLIERAQTSGPLWLDVNASYVGPSDRLPQGDADRLDHSLKLVHPTKLKIHVVRTVHKRQVRASFAIGDEDYNLLVVDPKTEAQFFRLSDGVYPYEAHALACISLGEPREGYRYKLLAGLINLPR